MIEWGKGPYRLFCWMALIFLKAHLRPFLHPQHILNSLKIGLPNLPQVDPRTFDDYL